MTTGVVITDTAGPLLDDIQGSMVATIRKGMTRAAFVTDGVIKRLVMQEHPDGRGGLARSYKPSLVKTSGDRVTTGVFSDLVYAGIQNRGGTITPRNTKALAIPVNKSIPVGKWPRHFGKGELFPIKSKRGNLLLVKKLGNGGFEPMYVLKKSVQIKGSQYLDKSQKKAAPLIQKELGDAVKVAVTESGKKVAR